MKTPPLRLLLLLSLLLLPTACGPDAQPPGEPTAPTATAPQLPHAGTVAAADELPIAYTLDGPALADSQLPTLVFVHGWSCDQSYWEGQVQAFKDRYRVLTLDLPGHGESGRERGTWSVKGLGADLALALEALDLQHTVLIGHSMGAPVSMIAARAQPARVDAVVVVDSFQSIEPMDPVRWQPLLDAYRSDFAGTCAQFVRGFFQEGADPARVEQVLSNMCEGPPEVVVPLFESFFDLDMRDVLTSVAVPVRLINASLYPTQVQDQVAVDEVDLQVRILPDTGHFLMLEQPEAFNRLLAETLEGLSEAPASAPSTSE